MNWMNEWYFSQQQQQQQYSEGVNIISTSMHMECLVFQFDTKKDTVNVQNLTVTVLFVEFNICKGKSRALDYKVNY